MIHSRLRVFLMVLCVMNSIMGMEQKPKNIYELWHGRANPTPIMNNQIVPHVQNIQALIPYETSTQEEEQAIVSAVSQQPIVQPERPISPQDAKGHASTENKNSSIFSRLKKFFFRPEVLMPIVATGITVAIQVRLHEKVAQLLQQSLSLQQTNEQLLRSLIASQQIEACVQEQLSQQQALVTAVDAQALKFEFPVLKEKLKQCTLV